MAPDNIHIGHVWEAVGEIKGLVNGVDTRLGTIERNTEIIRGGYIEHNKEIGALQQQNMMQARSISNLYQTVGKVEDTGIIQVSKFQGIWSTLKYVGSIALALTTLALALYVAF